LNFNRPFEKYGLRENGVMRFNMPLLRRFFGKVIHDILPAALASLLGGFLITHFQLNRVPEPVTVPVARASPEMMQLLRDEHGLIVNFVKAQVANEKSANEKKQLGADESTARAPAEAQTAAGAAAAPAAPRPTMIVALTPAKPAAPHAKPPVVGASVVGASLPPLATAPAQQSESAPPPAVARNDDSLLAKTIGIKDHVVAATQRAVSAIGIIPSWFGSIGDRIGGEDPSPRPPANLVSEL
jgi:hypothetical protein